MELAALLGLAGIVLTQTQRSPDPPSDAYDDPTPTPTPPKQPDAIDPAIAGRSAAGPPPLFDPASVGERSFAEFMAEGQGAVLARPPPASAADIDRLAPSQQPYFRSERTQGFNPRTAQFKSELFSGRTRVDVSETGTWQHRQEQAKPFFNPQESAVPVSSSGRSDNPTFDVQAVRDRFVISGTQKNVLPAEQLRVGPAVGYAANVAAADGFHPFLRVMPNNVGSYKLTQLPGDVIPGAAPVPTATSRFFKQNKNVDSLKMYERKEYPMAATGDPSLQGPTVRSEEPRQLCNNRGNKHPGDIGCARAPPRNTCGSGGVAVNTAFALLRDQAGSRPIGYEQFEATRESNNRSQNPHATLPGPVSMQQGTLAHGMTAPQFVTDEGRFEKLHRESLRPFSDLVGVQAASSRAIAPPGSVEAQWTAPQTTMRDVTGAVPFNVGIAAPAGDRSTTVTAPQRQGAYLQLDRHAKRGDQVREYTPGPSMSRPDNKTHGKVGIKGSRERGGRIMGTAELQVGRPGVVNEHRGNDTRYGRKTGPNNVRLWNSLAADQLKQNEFAKTIASLA